MYANVDDNSSQDYWIKGVVIKGDQIGRTLGYPTINLEPSLLQNTKEGIYASLVNVKGDIYPGALFYGPRKVLSEIKTVLEIHILDFNADIYEEKVAFQLLDYIRGIDSITSLAALREQLKKDCEDVRRCVNRKNVRA